MNLIEIQENLKDLPIQAIMGYANGQNPEVPPYMALGELNRRKAMENRATQAPTQSVKEQLESEMSGLPSVMPPPVSQGMPPQGMPPQGMPPQRPPMPQQMPQQMPRPPMQGMPQMAPPRMAAGGLTNIPMNKDIFKYAPGGIVAFADESNEQLVPGGGGEMGEGTAGEAEARANMTDRNQGPPDSAQPPSGVSSLVGDATQALRAALRGESNIPAPVDKEAVREELIKKNPQMAAILSKIPGDTLMALVAKLQAQNETSKAQFQEGEGKMGLAALSNALISAGEATRGQKGSGFGEAFGGFGKSYNAATADEIKRKQAQSALERAQDIEVTKLQADTEAMQRAFAEGRVNDAMELKKSIAERQAKIDAAKLQAGEKVLSQATQEQQMQGTLAHYKALEKQAKLDYDERVRHNASQAEIEKARLRMQEATKNAELALRQEQMDQLAGTKLTAEDKIANNVERNLLRTNSDYAEINKRIAALPIDKLDSQEGKFLRALRDKIKNDAYIAAKLTPPTASTLPKYEEFAPPPVKEEKSALEKWFSGEGNSISSMGSETPAAPQLPASRANQFKVLR
jgi:hypothetical protein